MPSPGLTSNPEISDPESPLLSWEEIHPKLLLPPVRRSPVRDDSHITTLLSASSYHLPEQSNYRPQTRPPQHARSPLYGGLIVNAASSPEEANNRDSSEQEEPPKRRRRRVSSPDNGPSSALVKKRGRPRKTSSRQMDKEPDEVGLVCLLSVLLSITKQDQRRRAQIRLAQRAYRSRKEASMSSLQSRIAQLETNIEQMSGAVVSFNDGLVQAGVLESDSGLAGHWHDTVQTCLTLAKENQHEHDHERENLGNNNPFPNEETPSPASMSTGHELPSEPPIPNIDPALHNNHPPDTFETTTMDLSTFMERLHLACIYEGYLMLSNPSINISCLKKPFLFLLSIMDRKRATSYFKACLHARSGLLKTSLDEWDEIVPFFCLGGAGTHYRRSRSSWTQRLSKTDALLPRYVTVEDPLAQFPVETRREMDGEWFDIQDLEGFLREQGVWIVPGAGDGLSSSKLKAASSAQMVVDAAGFIPGNIAFSFFAIYWLLETNLS